MCGVIERVRAVALLFLISIGFNAAEADDASYFVCKSCHEQDGSGNEAIGAPAIAGMSADYVATQMRKFRDGIRGASIDDLPGRQMNLIATVLTDDAEIDAVAAYVAALPGTDSHRTIDVAAEAGAEHYAACAVCHGESGGGKKEMAAPAIAGFADWYVRSQLTRFRDGVRGSHPDDQTGAQMRAATAGLSDETIAALSAYVAELAR